MKPAAEERFTTWPPRPRSHHRRHEEVAAVDHAAEVDAEDPVPVLERRVERSPPPRPTPALFTSRSTAATRAWTSSAKAAHRLGARHVDAAGEHVAAERAGAALGLGEPGFVTSQKTSPAPRRASASAVARPMPLPAPVTSAVRPSRFVMSMADPPTPYATARARIPKGTLPDAPPHPTSRAAPNSSRHELEQTRRRGGRGHGFVTAFDLQGNFQKRLVSNGDLNSPLPNIALENRAPGPRSAGPHGIVDGAARATTTAGGFGSEHDTDCGRHRNQQRNRARDRARARAQRTTACSRACATSPRPARSARRRRRRSCRSRWSSSTSPRRTRSRGPSRRARAQRARSTCW